MADDGYFGFRQYYFLFAAYALSSPSRRKLQQELCHTSLVIQSRWEEKAAKGIVHACAQLGLYVWSRTVIRDKFLSGIELESLRYD